MKKKTLTIKMALDTVLSGSREVKKRSWRFKKKIPISSPMTKKLGRRLKKLTKFMGLFVLATAMILLMGCGRRLTYTEPEEIAVVSAIGVDNAEDGVAVSLQTVDEGGVINLSRAEGESISAALAELYAAGTREFELSHCALAVLGDSLSAERVGELYELCLRRDGISGAIMFVGADNAAALLSPTGTVGYDIASSMRSSPDGAGLFSRSRLYEIVDTEARTEHAVTAIPYFRTGEGGFSLCGLRLYLDRREIALLDRFDGAIYLMLSGIFTSGRVVFGDGKTAAIADCALVGSGDGTVTIRLTLAEAMSDGDRALLVRSLKAAARDLRRGLTEDCGDILSADAEVEFTIEGAAI